MPLVDDKLTMLLGKLLCAGKLACFQTEGFTKLDRLLYVEDRFAPAIANMDMNWPVVVAVKKETISVLLKNRRHRL